MAGTAVETGREEVEAAEVDTPEPPITDWVLRPFALTGASPFWTGAALAAAFLAISLAGRALIEQSAAVWQSPYIGTDILSAVLFAYIPTAIWLLRRGRLRDLRELRPVLRCDAATLRALERETVCVPPRRLAVSGAIGALAVASMPVFDPAFWPGERPSLDHPWMIFMIGRHVATGWLAGHSFASETAATIAFYRIGKSRLQVDLHDLGPLAPFARAGQRSAFVWVLLASLVSLFWLGPSPGSSNGPILVATLLAVSAAYFFSIQGAHLSIRQTKREALERLASQIQARGAHLLDGSDPALPVSELIALHGFIAQQREWPIGVPALLRGSLIGVLAVGGWLGGALVERVIELLLD